MSKYFLLNTGNFSTVEEALLKRSITTIAAFDTLKDARDVKKSVELVSRLNFEATETNPTFKSSYQIITVKEVE